MTAQQGREAGSVSRPVPPSEEHDAARQATAAVFGDSDAGSDLTWGVGAVSNRLQITASTLRTWERRYGVGPSFRTQGGHRRYTERDIDRVELMRRLVSRGVSAQDAARVARTLDRDQLDLALSDGLGREAAHLPPEDLVDAVMAAVVTGALDRLSQLVAGLLRSGRVIDTWRDVLSPALVRMSGEGSAGTLPADSEASAISVLVAELRERVIAERLPETGKTNVLIARGIPQSEALALFAVEAALSQAGVFTRAVGPEVSSRMVGSLVTELRPDVLLTWGHPPDSPPLRRALDKLDGATFVVRALPAWPHEISLRFGFDAPLVSTDVSGAVELLLDRVSSPGH